MVSLKEYQQLDQQQQDTTPQSTTITTNTTTLTTNNNIKEQQQQQQSTSSLSSTRLINPISPDSSSHTTSVEASPLSTFINQSILFEGYSGGSPHIAKGPSPIKDPLGSLVEREQHLPLGSPSARLLFHTAFDNIFTKSPQIILPSPLVTNSTTSTTTSNTTTQSHSNNNSSNHNHHTNHQTSNNSNNTIHSSGTSSGGHNQSDNEGSGNTENLVFKINNGLQPRQQKITTQNHLMLNTPNSLIPSVNHHYNPLNRRNTRSASVGFNYRGGVTRRRSNSNLSFTSSSGDEETATSGDDFSQTEDEVEEEQESEDIYSEQQESEEEEEEEESEEDSSSDYLEYSPPVNKTKPTKPTKTNNKKNNNSNNTTTTTKSTTPLTSTTTTTTTTTKSTTTIQPTMMNEEMNGEDGKNPSFIYQTISSLSNTFQSISSTISSVLSGGNINTTHNNTKSSSTLVSQDTGSGGGGGGGGNGKKNKNIDAVEQNGDSVMDESGDADESDKTKKKRKKNGEDAGRWCHQCKALKYEFIQCQAASLGKPKCNKRFCSTCLTKHYNKEVSVLKARPKPWWCPFCKNTCICAACKRKRENGEFPPLGVLLETNGTSTTSTTTTSSNGENGVVNGPSNPMVKGKRGRKKKKLDDPIINNNNNNNNNNDSNITTPKKITRASTMPVLSTNTPQHQTVQTPSQLINNNINFIQPKSPKSPKDKMLLDRGNKIKTLKKEKKNPDKEKKIVLIDPNNEIERFVPAFIYNIQFPPQPIVNVLTPSFREFDNYATIDGYTNLIATEYRGAWDDDFDPEEYGERTYLESKAIDDEHRRLREMTTMSAPTTPLSPTPVSRSPHTSPSLFSNGVGSTPMKTRRNSSGTPIQQIDISLTALSKNIKGKKSNGVSTVAASSTSTTTFATEDGDSSDEDTDDEIYLKRHEKVAEEERIWYTTFNEKKTRRQQQQLLMQSLNKSKSAPTSPKALTPLKSPKLINKDKQQDKNKSTKTTTTSTSTTTTTTSTPPSTPPAFHPLSVRRSRLRASFPPI